jgi:hypothetical protein
MKLLNVRLNPEDARMAEHLRRGGVAISAIVRDAIRAAYDRQVTGRRSGRRAKDIMADIYRQYPDPPNLPPREFDVHDRRSARRAILKRLQQRRG